MRAVEIVLGLVLLILPAAAQDKPDTAEQASDKVLAALKAEEREALKALAERNIPDPWLVADELCFRDALEAAQAFARAAPGKAVERLSEYVEAQRVSGPDRKGRESVVLMNAALERGDWEAAAGAGKGLGAPMTSLSRVRLAHGRGMALAELGRREESAAAYALAAEGARTLGWLARLGGIHRDAGHLAFSHSDWPGALAAWRERLKLAEDLDDKLAISASLQDLGVAHRNLGEPRKALEVFGRAVVMERVVGDRAGVAWTLKNIGIVHGQLREYRQALQAYERALEIQETLDDAPEFAKILGAIGGTSLRLRENPRALEAYRRLLEVLEARDDEAGLARALNNIGILHRRLGDYPAALEAYRRSLAVKEKLGDKVGVAKTLFNMGLIQMNLREFPEAIEAFRRSLAIREKLDDKVGVAKTLGYTGLAHSRSGAYAEAVEAYRRSLTILETLDDKRAIAETLINLGNVESRRGEYAKALAACGRALDLFTSLRSKRGIAASLHVIGVVHRQLGEYRKALEAYGRALELKKGLGDAKGAAETLNNMGSAYQFLGEDEKALDAYRGALANRETHDDKPGMAAILNNIGSVHQERGELKKALTHFHRSREMHEGLGDMYALAEVLNNIGVVHQDLGEWESAMAFHRKSLDVLGVIPGAVPRTRALWGLAIGHLGLEQWSAAVGRARDSVAVVEHSFMRLGEQQGATARGRWSGVFETGTFAALRKGDVEDLAFFLESGRAGSLLESLGSREALRSVLIPEDLRAKEIAARETETRAAAALRAVAASGILVDIRRARKAFDRARAELENLIPQIQRSAKAGAAIAYPEADDLSDIQKGLGAGEALVLFGLARGEALALVVRRQSARIVRLHDAAEVLSATDALLLEGPPYVDSKRVDGLTRLVVAPLGIGEDVERVLVSPVGRLGYVPFSLLMPDKEVSYVQSGTTHRLLLRERDLRGEGVVALGDPDYGTMGSTAVGADRGAAVIRLSALPETRKEVAAIASVQLLGKRAGEVTLRSTLPTRERWRALHFACHGLIDPDHPMLSALALAADGENDGLLTCLEVFRLDVHADLVVLSGCETGKGKIYGAEGIVGFTRAFMFAGAPRVLVSLWRVDDAATRVLMVKFYELWNPKEGKGLPAATALKKAQEYVRGHEKWKHPYYWAAWVLWGLPD